MERDEEAEGRAGGSGCGGRRGDQEEISDLKWEEEVATCVNGRSLVGKLLTEKQVNKNTAISMIKKGWNVQEDVSIMEVGNNTFLFSFANLEDYNRVNKGRPWTILGSLLNIQRCSSNVIRVGSRVGDRGCLCWRVYGFPSLVLPGLAKVWVSGNYEKLSHFCFNCGRIGHEDRLCKDKEKVLTGDGVEVARGSVARDEVHGKEPCNHENDSLNGLRKVHEAESPNEPNWMDWVGPEVVKPRVPPGVRIKCEGGVGECVDGSVANKDDMLLDPSFKPKVSIRKGKHHMDQEGKVGKAHLVLCGISKGPAFSPSRYIVELPSDDESGIGSALVPFSHSKMDSDVIVGFNRVSLKRPGEEVTSPCEAERFRPGKFDTHKRKRRGNSKSSRVNDDSLVEVPVESEELFPKDWIKFKALASDGGGFSNMDGSDGWPSTATKGPKYKPQVVFLMETRSSGVKMEAIKRRNRFQFNNACSKNIIHASCSSSQIEGAWPCVGDFNYVLYHSEKWGGKPKATRKILNFQSLLSDCGLFDLEYKGAAFTWSNKRFGEAFVKEKLDRALGNVDLFNSFPKAQAFVNDPVGSNHGALGWFKVDALRFDFILELLSSQLHDCFSDGFSEEKKCVIDKIVADIEKAWDREELYWFQSVLEGRKLLLEGVCWKIGDGASVLAFKDKWIPGLAGCKLSDPGVARFDDLRVKDLISAGRWDLGLIQDSISQRERKAILSVPIPRVGRVDKLVWEGSKNGEYAVKTGYKCAMGVFPHVSPSGPSCSFSPPPSLWRVIWSLKVIPKVKSFLWRACMGALPTSEALFKRKCAYSPCCQICGVEAETIEHSLLLCKWAKCVWFAGPLAVRVEAERVTRFDVWCMSFLVDNANLDEDGKALFAFTCWEIWKSRCEHIFMGARVGSSLPSNPSTASGPPARWSFPTAGELRVIVDGAFQADSLEAGIGIIVRDDCGLLRKALCCKALASSSFMCESLALSHALAWVKDFQGLKLTFETDCEELFNLVFGSGSSSGHWQCDDILAEILSAASSQWVSFSLVRRSGNQAADWLAKCAVKGFAPSLWVVNPPPPLASILASDREGASRSGVSREGIG
ncbi:reverse transcriptase [Senna tora]|uniref:Reverse transcriptase n=1 Tax=Senna tora TaxID=362788 RepID=A0A834SW40_9FABA|nr:reverse transcriptase [Senna tora]